MKVTIENVELLRRVAMRLFDAGNGGFDEHLVRALADHMQAELPAPLNAVRCWIDVGVAMAGHVVCVHFNRRVSDEDLPKIHAALKAL